VLPNSGFEVALDTNKIEALARRWRESSYPSLSVSAEDTTNEADHLDSSHTTEDPTPISVSESDRLDDQLWVAVEALKLD